VTKYVPYGERSLWALLLSLPIAYLITSATAPYIIASLLSGSITNIEISATGKKSENSLGAEIWMERPSMMSDIPNGWESRGDRIVSYIPPYGPLKLSVPVANDGITFIKQNRSGIVEITAGQTKKKIDLYNATEKPTTISGIDLAALSGPGKRLLTPAILLIAILTIFPIALFALKNDSILSTIIDRPAESKNTKYEPRLDHLRFLAAAMVIFYHCFTDNFGLGHSTYNPLLGLVEQGHMGVGLFMVLSGYLLAKIAIGKDINYFDFLKNRILRIYPLYTFCIIIMLCGWGYQYSFTQALSMFLPFVNTLQGVELPMFAHLWTIAVEFQFYLIFPFLMMFMGKTGPRFILGLLTLTIFFKYLIWVKTGSTTNVSYMTLLGRIDQLLIGIFAAFLSKKYIQAGTLNNRWLLLAVSASAIIVAIFCGQKGLIGLSPSKAMAVWPSIEAVMWAAIIVGYSNARFRIPESIDVSLARLGQLSFSMYCMHYVVIPFTNSHFAKLGVADSFSEVILQTALLTIPAIVLFSILTYGVIEKPFFTLKHKYANPHQETNK
jgi:peptidoglycan/LPS O-acetylase OafA/YrhL